MIDVGVSISAADIAEMENMFARYVERFNGNAEKAMRSTMVKIIVAMRGSTMRSARQRKVVPLKFRQQSENTYIRQHGHIQQWYEDHPGARHTGQQGKLAKVLPRLASLGGGAKMAKKAIERRTQKGTRYTPIPGSTRRAKDAKAIAAALFPKSYYLDDRGNKRRGIAASSWGWMMRKMGRAASTDNPPSIIKRGNPVAVSEYRSDRRGDLLVGIEGTNSLNYIRKATKSNVNSVVERAAKMMAHEIERYKARMAA